MDSFDKFKKMIEMQQKLNDETNGLNWEEGYNKNGKIINWRRCIYMECAELIDSFSWKHWKNIDKAPDWENVKVEIVDIWHFVMSFGLESYKFYGDQKIEKLLKIITEDENFDDFNNETTVADFANANEIVNLAEHLIHICSGYETNMFEKIVGEFFTIAHKCGLNVDDLYRFYMAKNILNKFRQDNGYKNGKYIKNWNAKEDNEVMIEILKNNSSLTPEKIYELLEEEYKKVNYNL